MNGAFHIGGFRHTFLRYVNTVIGLHRSRLLWSIVGVLVFGFAISSVLMVHHDDSFADVTDGQSVVDFRFLNTQTGDGFDNGEGYSANESNLIVTKDNKYVLIDTGNNDQGIRKRIKAELNKYQNGGSNGNVVIDYLIISHLDYDHYGNAVELIANTSITVKNVVVKREGAFSGVVASKKDAYDNIVRAAKTEKANLYTNTSTYQVDGSAVKDYSKYHLLNKEGVGNAVLSVGSYLTLYLYNTTDVFSGKTCTEGYRFKFTSNVDGDYAFMKDSKGRYYRINNTSSSYPNWSYEYSNKLTAGGTDFATYYYAYNTNKKAYSCLSNANSYGVLAEVKTNTKNKYVYFPNDMDNYGYGLEPTKTNVTYYSSKSGKDVTKSNHQVYGNGVGKLYKGSTMSDLVNNNLTANQNKTYSETKVALEIADKLGSNLSDLVIYQVSHHGSNNAPDAINILNINRSDMMTVNNRNINIKSGSDVVSRRTHYYTLSNTKKWHTGYNKGNGVYCAINASGAAACGYEDIKAKTVTYNLNGGSGSIAGQSCWSSGACSMTVSNTVPTRSGYKFLGWATSSGSATATYTGGKTISVSSNMALYAVWAPVYTLSYNVNGGTGSLTSSSCNPSSTSGSCTITISVISPVRDGYEFLGWNTSSSATTATYTNGSKVTMQGNKTLYAVWKMNTRTVNVNTSVNGSGGTISNSLQNVTSGSLVVITFTPNDGYEIDNVKVDDVITSDAHNNQLSLIVGDHDINVVVTYKESDSEPPIGPPIYAIVMSFSEANGGEGFPESVSCTTTTNYCSIKLPMTKPTKAGFKFLGYGFASDTNTVVYVPGGVYKLTQNVEVVGIWAPIYTLSYDMNGGTGTIENQTCSPSASPLESCAVSLSTVKPTKDGYIFFGWASDADATLPDYSSGDIFEFAQGVTSETVYAVWINESIEVEWWQGQSYEHDLKVDLILKINYPLDDFVSLSIDGSQIDDTVYSVRSGSTIITISGEYIDGLADGEHILQAEYRNDITANTNFTVSSNGSSDSDTDTGDDGDDQSDEVVDPSEEPGADMDIVVPNTGSGVEEGSGRSVTMMVVIAPVLLAVLYLGFGKNVLRKSRIGFEKH